MYEEILALIDWDLDRLQRARRVLLGGREEATVFPLKTPAKPVRRAERQAAEGRPNLQSMLGVQERAAPATPKRARRPRPAAEPVSEPASAALRPVIPSGPVAVPAAEVRRVVKARAMQAEARPASLPEGTLDALVREIESRGALELARR